MTLVLENILFRKQFGSDIRNIKWILSFDQTYDFSRNIGKQN